MSLYFYSNYPGGYNGSSSFFQQPKKWGKLIDDNTNYDGTGDVVELFVAGENGSRIEIKGKPLGTNVAKSCGFL